MRRSGLSDGNLQRPGKSTGLYGYDCVEAASGKRSMKVEMLRGQALTAALSYYGRLFDATLVAIGKYERPAEVLRYLRIAGETD